MKKNKLVKTAEHKVYFPFVSINQPESPKVVEGEYWPLYSWLDMLIKPWGETTMSRIELLALILTTLSLGILIGRL